MNGAGPLFSPAHVALAMSELRRDPLFPRLSPAYAQELVQAALTFGAATAARFGTRPVGALGAELGVRIIWSDDAPVHAGLALRAEYRSRPPEVRIYRGTLRRLAVQNGLALAKVEEVALAHELFHHVEPQLPWRDLPHFELWRFGRWRRMVLPLRAREIAAHAFAMQMAEVPWFPTQVDA